MRKRLLSALVLISVLLLLLPATYSRAFADSPAPECDYIQEIAGGKFVFVMLAVDNPPSACGQSDVVQDNEIRSQYPQSGLYRNDGSHKPLWTVNWYTFEAEISSDGKYLARWGPWPLSNNYSELALAFYEEGREIRKYRVNELVVIPEILPHSMSHYMWEKSASFDDKNNLLFVETENGEKYTFDIATGAIVEGNRPIPRLFIVLAVGGVAVLIYVVLHVRQRRNSHS